MVAIAAKTRHAIAWALARAQHGLITRIQLLALGFTDAAIKHRIATGRLRAIYPGVYAVGRLPLTREGEWIAALLACGDGAALSHESAAELWGLAGGARAGRGACAEADPIHVSTLSRSRSRDGIVVHRRRALQATTRQGIRVTTPARTLIDLAPSWPREQLEQAIGEATLRGLVNLKSLRTAATEAGRSGAALRSVIEPLTFRVTQSELERAFLRLVERSGLALPDTQTRFGRTRVDFHWPQIGLVVETDGARFHATAKQQAEDRRRDQEHIRAGRIPLRLTHWQVFREPAETTALLVDVFVALRARSQATAPQSRLSYAPRTRS